MIKIFNKVIGTDDINKDEIYKFSEVMISLKLIKDSIDSYHRGSYPHLNIILGQLRALVLDTSRRDGKLEPLLKDIFISKNFNSKLFYKLTPIEIEKKNKYIINSPKLSDEQIDKNYTETDIWSFLENTAITFINNERGSVKKSFFDILKETSNKLGGSHYDLKIPVYMSELLFEKYDGGAIFDKIIIEFAELIYKLGLNFIKKIIDMEIHLYNFRLNKLTGRAPIISSNHHDTLRGSQLYFEKNKILFSIKDIFNKTASVKFDLNQLSGNNFIYISHFISKDLKTVLEIGIDEKIVDRIEIDVPICLERNFFLKKIKFSDKFQISGINIYIKQLNFFERQYESQRYNSNLRISFSKFQMNGYNNTNGIIY